MKPGFVIDSTIFVPEDIRTKHNIKVVPLKVIWDNDEYRENVDISAEEFYKKLAVSKTFPRTSAPSPMDFLNVYTQMAKEGYDHIFSIHISSRLSGTYQAASVAASMSTGVKVHLVDSLSTSIAAGIIVMEMVRAAETCAGPEQVLAIAYNIKNSIDLRFVVDDLTYLHRGGRISSLKHVLGKLVKLKPVLGLKDGEIVIKDKLFGNTDMTKYVDLFMESYKERKRTLSYIVLGYGVDETLIAGIVQKMVKFYPQTNIYSTRISPVIGSHTGPFVTGVALY